MTVLVVVWAGAGTASSLSFTPSGLGIVEPILAAGLVAAGIHHTSALAATALYRLISFLLLAAAGWIVQLSLIRRAPVVALAGVGQTVQTFGFNEVHRPVASPTPAFVCNFNPTVLCHHAPWSPRKRTCL